MSQLTPLMKQYWEIKSLHQDKILLFRMGDFFEMFYDDAVTSAPILGIALTQRNKKSQDETPMCGMPHHAIAGPINKLLAHGYKVAICDQIEDPKLAKGIVRRAVTRILTPGMVYDPDTLESQQAHYICSLDEHHMAFLDCSTGEAFYFSQLQTREIQKFLDVLNIAEIVIGPEQKEWAQQLKFSSSLSLHEGLVESGHVLLSPSAPAIVRRLISYVESLSLGSQTLNILKKFEERDLVQKLEVNPSVLRHLEIFTNYKGEAQGSFFHAINKTKTAVGARILRQWVLFPLRKIKDIQERQQEIEYWRGRPVELKRIREVFGHLGDLERRLGKVSVSQCQGRDVLALGQSLRTALAAYEIYSSSSNSIFNKDLLLALSIKIENTLVEDPPLSVRQGGLIRKGVSVVLDEWIELSTQSHVLLQKMEAAEREKTGISSLKIRYNNVFGYYIEITHTHKDKVPSHYQRKQTLANAERFYTEELLDLERKVLAAQSQRFELEYEIFEGLRKEVLQCASEILILAKECGRIDVLSSLAWLSLEQNYQRPEFSVAGELSLKASRHPVVEISVKKNFTANDIVLQPHSCLLLTGPNMAGKSTLMRQVALTAWLAQMGSYVPAASALLPLFDAIYTRIGASDQLSEGLSTFMVEMTETAYMLEHASKNSLVILDEIGRGTSTFDGMALAQAILEHLLTEVHSITLFATHYHELSRLPEVFSQVQNAHMRVAEKNGDIRFLYTLTPGPAVKSYGIHVAELAGLPSALTKRARGLLKNLEGQKLKVENQLSLLDFEEEFVLPTKENPQQSILIEDLKKYPLQQVTPLEAMNQIALWQNKCRDL